MHEFLVSVSRIQERSTPRSPMEIGTRPSHYQHPGEDGGIASQGDGQTRQQADLVKLVGQEQQDSSVHQTAEYHIRIGDRVHGFLIASIPRSYGSWYARGTPGILCRPP